MLTERRPFPDDAELVSIRDAPKAADALLPIGRKVLALRGVLGRVGHHASMRARELHLCTGREMPGIATPDDFVPGARQPRLGDERHANNQDVEVWRAAALRLKLPHGAERGELTAQALEHRIELPFPRWPAARPRAGVRQSDEQQSAADVGDRHGAQRLLQSRARSAGELAHLPAAAVRRLAHGPRIPAAQLRAGAAFGRRYRAARTRGEVWTVDKPIARLGARRRAEQDERVMNRAVRGSFRLSAVLGQGSTPARANSRAPPCGRGGAFRCPVCNARRDPQARVSAILERY
jgi:hypothetical protein